MSQRLLWQVRLRQPVYQVLINTWCCGQRTHGKRLQVAVIEIRLEHGNISCCGEFLYLRNQESLQNLVFRSTQCLNQTLFHTSPEIGFVGSGYIVYHAIDSIFIGSISAFAGWTEQPYQRLDAIRTCLGHLFHYLVEGLYIVSRQLRQSVSYDGRGYSVSLVCPLRMTNGAYTQEQ